MRRSKKIISFIILILLVISIVSNVYAATCPECNGKGRVQTKDGTVRACYNCGGSGIQGSTQAPSHTTGDIIDGAGSFIQIGEEKADDKINPTNLENLSNTIYNILLVVGIIVALIVGLIMGMNFMLGSLEQKAEIKTLLIPYITGCVVVFGAFTIWKIVVDVLQIV